MVWLEELFGREKRCKSSPKKDECWGVEKLQSQSRYYRYE
jgi:hypothetical protein